MSKVLPERIDIARLADSQAMLDGTVPVVRFTRLVGHLASTAGAVHVTLGFSREDGREVVRGRIQGQLTLVCQRCLGGVDLPVVAEVDLVRVANEIEAGSVIGTHDPVVAPNRELVLAEIEFDEEESP